MQIVAIDPALPDRQALRAAGEKLRAGGLVAFPTETVYGLGADALNETAVARIYAAKGRPPTNPVIVHVLNVAAAQELVAHWPAEAEALARAFWPGPLTLVLPKHDVVPAIVTAGGPTVAVRAPAHPIARGLIEEAGRPIAAPSANRSTELSPTRGEHVARSLAGRIDLLLDGGPTAAGIESTVLDLSSDRPRVLRAGPIGPSELSAIIGPVEIGSFSAGEEPVDSPLRSPGLLERHYAPHTPLRVTADAAVEIARRTAAGERLGWVTTREARGDDPPRLVRMTLPSAARDYAAQLYAALHVLDAAGVAEILVDQPPAGEEWLAIRDRLRRASK